MNVGQLFQKCLDAYNAWRNGDKGAAFLIALEILKAFISSLPSNAVGRPLPVSAIGYTAGFDPNTATEDELMEELHDICTSPPSGSNMTAAVGDAAAGPVISLLLPIIAKLVLKWLGV